MSNAPSSADVDAAGLYCGGCGYDLRGSDGGRCPECGLSREAVPLALAWERGRDLGWVRGFFRTAWLATLRPGRLAMRTAAGADVRSAQRFRLIVLGLVWAAATVAFIVTCNLNGGRAKLSVVDGDLRLVNAPALFWSAGVMTWPVVPIGIAISLWLGTAWDHWFVLGGVSPAQRGRAMAAAARYTVAPLLLLLPLGGLLAVVFWERGGDDVPSGFDAAVGLSVLQVVVLGLILTGPPRFAMTVPGGGVGRAVLVLIGTVVQWAMAAALGVGVFPAVVGFVWVVVDSLR